MYCLRLYPLYKSTEECRNVPFSVRGSGFQRSIHHRCPLIKRAFWNKREHDPLSHTNPPLFSAPYFTEEGNCVKQCSDNLMVEELTSHCVPCPIEGCPKRESQTLKIRYISRNLYPFTQPLSALFTVPVWPLLNEA